MQRFSDMNRARNASDTYDVLTWRAFVAEDVVRVLPFLGLHESSRFLHQRLQVLGLDCQYLKRIFR